MNLVLELILHLILDACMFFMKEIPGHYKLPTEASVVKAAAGWAHCATVTGNASN
jgi:hypothetical protein